MHLSIYKLSGELDINLMIKNNENYHVKDVAYHMIVFFSCEIARESQDFGHVNPRGIFLY